MKRLALLIAICLPLLMKAQESKWLVYPSLGIDMGGAIPYTFSDIPEGAKGSPKLNPSLGLGIDYSFAEKWRIGLEVSYHVLEFSARADVRSQPFYFDNPGAVLYFSGKTNTNVELRFVEFSLMPIYNINTRWSLLVGGYYSAIMEGSFNTTGTDGVLNVDKTITDTAPLPGEANTSYNFNNSLDNWDAGLLIGYRYNLTHRINFWTNFNVGFNSIFKRDFENIRYEMYQLRLNAGVSLSLFSYPEKPSAL